ncbi:MULTISPECIES: hypothetical protein [Catenuloplanes]|uniref:Uncharacterized protein n=1 Tax=Catenuloplanes niger TaxID=587534 RepID=A0AAE3ZTC5_9ACTN|nr:hypothetical protein [Catenuloplanes niger]MDR7324561.1 hypothetical protein [Catenuloplanes niger]
MGFDWAERYDLSVAVWGLLIAGGSVIVALIFLAVVSVTTREPHRGPDPKLLRAEADELAAHASAAYAKAGRAAAAAEQARAAAAAAEQARDEAWAAQEVADAAYDAARKDVEDAAAEIAAAAALQSLDADADADPDTDADPESRPESGEDRDRTVSRAALGAYKRGEISVEELRDVFRVTTTDQSPLQSERERVAYRYQTEQRAAHRMYDRAAAAARAADEAARIAEIAAIALAEEAAEAAAEAHEAMLLAREHAGKRRR